MKKIVIALISTIVAIAALVASSITLAKYITDVKSGEFTIHAAKFYLRSDILGEPTTVDGAIHGESVSVNGTVANFVIANGANENKVSNVDFEYKIYYVVYDDGVRVQVDSMTETHSFSKDVYSAERFSVSPIVIGEKVFDKVLVIAQTEKPYKETVAAYFEFNYTAHTIDYAYDRDMGIITLSVVTNDEPGEYEFSWINGVLPDNADPNGIFNSSLAGESSITATLEAHTNYIFSFFVNPGDREYVDSLLSGMTDGQVIEMAKSSVTCVKK